MLFVQLETPRIIAIMLGSATQLLPTVSVCDDRNETPVCSVPIPLPVCPVSVDTINTTTQCHDELDIQVSPRSSTSHLRSQTCRNGNNLRTLTFQRHWIEQFPWLLIRHDIDGVLCRPCVEANLRLLMNDSVADGRQDKSFIQTGFSDWKHAIAKFGKHEQSISHKFACSQLAQSRAGVQIAAKLNDQLASEQALAKKALAVLLSSVVYLARQAIPLRGHDNDDGNFNQLLRLRQGDNDALAKWIMSGRYKTYTSWAIQNELLELSARQVLLRLCDDIRNSGMFSVIVDGTSDITCIEQESISVRYVDADLHPQEVFLGFYMLDGTEAEKIKDMICDVLLRCQLPTRMLRGQAYDGASNMAGKWNGTQALISKIQPLAVFVHCLMHSGNLAMLEAIEATPMIRDACGYANDLAVFSRHSTKLSSILKKVQQEHEKAASLLRPLCPTRVLCRGSALMQIMKYLEEILEALETYDGEASGVAASKAKGLLLVIGNGDFILAVKCMLSVILLMENLNRAVQSRSVSVSSMIASMHVTKDNLLSLRCDDKFKVLFDETVTMCTELDVAMPAMPKQRRPPKRFTGTANSHVWASSTEYFKVQYYNFIDTAVTALDKRYNQDGLRKYVALENLLRETTTSDVVCQVLAGYPDIDHERLTVQISMARQQQWEMSSVNAVADRLRSLDPAIRKMFNDLEQLVRLLLTVPCSNAEAERSFSALRRLKTYLRNSMKQGRLNHLAVMHVHQDRLDIVNQTAIAKEFVGKCESRQLVFGDFKN